MSDQQAGDFYIVVDEMPSGGTWGHPFTVNPDTWLVKAEPVRTCRIFDARTQRIDLWVHEPGLYLVFQIDEHDEERTAMDDDTRFMDAEIEARTQAAQEALGEELAVKRAEIIGMLEDAGPAVRARALWFLAGLLLDHDQERADQVLADQEVTPWERPF